MKCKIEITSRELARIFRTLAFGIEQFEEHVAGCDRTIIAGYERAIIDSNGNTVGKLKITK